LHDHSIWTSAFFVVVAQVRIVLERVAVSARDGLPREDGVLAFMSPFTLDEECMVEFLLLAVLGRAFVGDVDVSIPDWPQNLARFSTESDDVISFRKATVALLQDTFRETNRAPVFCDESLNLYNVLVLLAFPALDVAKTSKLLLDGLWWLALEEHLNDTSHHGLLAFILVT